MALNDLAQKLKTSNMTVLANILESGEMPPLEFVQNNRDKFASTLEENDPNLHEKKWLLEDLDNVIYNIKQANGEQDVWDEIVEAIDEFDKTHPRLRVVR